jgi:preprotein translocase subunit SecE
MTAKSKTTKSKSKFRYFKEVRAELRKVNWPNKEDLFKATGVVIVTVAVFALAMTLVDSIFTQVIQFLI